jgi:hypothetical protein
LLPLILSLLGAGVCAKDLRPGLFMYESKFVACNKDILLYLWFIILKNYDMFDLKSPDFLGGNNVHNVIIIGLLVYLTYKASK